MKVFGGNGQRENAQDGSSQSVPQRNMGNTGRSNINDNYYGNNNAVSVKKGATPPKKPKKKGKGVRNALIIILAIIGGTYAYWHFTTKPPDISNNTDAGKSATQTAGPQTSAQIANSGDREAGRYYTVLLVGKDVAGQNTDTIMLARYDAVEHKVNVCSLPRDTIANIAAPTKKLNNVYAYNNCSIDALMDGVKDICGFKPDSYVFIDTATFAKVIDKLGGVDFDVPVNMNYEDDVQNLSINIKKGYQHLDGDQTMKVFRFRNTYKMGDIDRLNVQHDLIKACASQMLKLGNIDKLFAAAKIVTDNAKTNLTYGNMQWYAGEFLKMSMDDINFMTLPGNNSCIIKNVSYVSINVDEWMVMVNQYLNPNINPIKAEDCNILYQVAPESEKYTVTKGNYVVTNGGKIAGGINSFYKN